MRASPTGTVIAWWYATRVPGLFVVSRGFRASLRPWFSGTLLALPRKPPLVSPSDHPSTLGFLDRASAPVA